MAANIMKYIMMAVVIVVAILAINYVLGGYSAPAAKATTTVPRQATTTLLPNTTNSSTTTVAPYVSCLSTSPNVAIYNGNFSAGNYSGWTVQGLGFGSVPVNLLRANANGSYYGSPWSGASSDYAAMTYQGGTFRSTGNITSGQFEVTEPYLNFQIISAQSNYLYVEILENGKPFLINHYNTFDVPGVVNAQSTFMNASIPVASLLCQNISVKVASGVVNTRNSRYTYIAVTGIHLSNTRISTPGILVNSSVV